MVGKKALANRAFLIDAWNNSINTTKRPPKNKQELYDIAKATYAHINDGADFTCSTHDLAFAIRDLKKEYYSNSFSIDVRSFSYSNINDSSVLFAENQKECDSMQERMIRNARILIGSEIEARLASIINENNEAKAKLDKALAKLDKAQALLRANNIDFDPNEFALGESTANKLDAALNNACLCDDSDCNCIVDKSKQALNSVLKNVVPGLDHSVDKILKDVSSTTAEIAPESVGKADKLPSKQASLIAMPAKGQEPSTEAIKALDSSDNKPRDALPEQAGMLIYKQKSDDNEQLLIRVFS